LFRDKALAPRRGFLLLFEANSLNLDLHGEYKLVPFLLAFRLQQHFFEGGLQWQ
jgi:hypothetical protein